MNSYSHRKDPVVSKEIACTYSCMMIHDQHLRPFWCAVGIAKEYGMTVPMVWPILKDHGVDPFFGRNS